MKAIVLLMLLAVGGTAQIMEKGFTAKVEAMWRNGDYGEVRKLAEKRLSANSEDLAGLLLLFEYAVEYLDLGEVSKAADKIIAVGSRAKTPRFSRLYPGLVFQLRAIQEAAKGYSPEALEKDRKKSGLKGKSLGCAYELRALEDDGLKQ